MCVDVVFAKGIFESTHIEALIAAIFYSYNDISSGIFGAVNSQFALAILNVRLHINSHNSIVVALISNIGHQFAVHLSLGAIWLGYSDSDIVIALRSAFGWIIFQAEGVVRINNRQRYSVAEMLACIKSIDIDGGAQQAFVSSNVSFGGKGVFATKVYILNSFTICTDIGRACQFLDAVAINIHGCNIYFLSESNFIRKDGHSVGALVERMQGQLQAFRSAEVGNIEVNQNAVARFQGQADSVFTRDQISCRSTASVFKGEGVFIQLWTLNDYQISGFKGRTLWSIDQSYIGFIITGEDWFIADFIIRQGVTLVVFDADLHSVIEYRIVLVSTVPFIAGKNVTIFFYNTNIISLSFFSRQTNGKGLVANSDLNRDVSLIMHDHSSGEFTVAIGFYSYFIDTLAVFFKL